MEQFSANHLQFQKLDYTRISLKATLTLFFFVANVFVVLFVILLVPIWLTVRLMAKVLRPDLGQIISDMTTNFTIHSQDNCRASLNHYLILDGTMTAAKFRELWDKRIMCARRPNGELLFSRFRESWTHFLGYPFWKPDRSFSLEHHIRDYDLDGDFALPTRCQEKDLQRMMGRLASRLYREDCSPWEVLLIQNYRLLEDSKTPRTVVLFRHHHALIDGYGLVSLMRLLFQSKYSVPEVKFPNVPLWLRALAILKMPYDTAEMLLNAFDGLDEWHVQPDTPRELEASMTSPIPIDKVKAVKRKLKTSYSAVIFTAVAAAIERVAKENKMKVPQNMGVHFPFPKPNHPGGSVNNLYMVGARWKIACGSPTERALSIQRSLTEMANSTVPEMGLWVSRGIALVPTVILRNIFVPLISRGSIIISAFPATTDTVYLDNVKIRHLYSCIGASYGNPSIGVLVTGCNGNQHAVVTWNKHVFADFSFDRIGSYIEDELNKLLCP